MHRGLDCSQCHRADGQCGPGSAPTRFYVLVVELDKEGGILMQIKCYGAGKFQCLQSNWRDTYSDASLEAQPAGARSSQMPALGC